jgi:addiction module HigA family antidote
MLKNPPHPGEMIRDDVLKPLGLDVTEAAARLGMARVSLSRVVNGPDLAVRLERAGVGTAHFWLTVQMNYELAQAIRRKPTVRSLRGA